VFVSLCLSIRLSRCKSVYEHVTRHTQTSRIGRVFHSVVFFMNIWMFSFLKLTNHWVSDREYPSIDDIYTHTHTYTKTHTQECMYLWTKLALPFNGECFGLYSAFWAHWQNPRKTWDCLSVPSILAVDNHLIPSIFLSFAWSALGSHLVTSPTVHVLPFQLTVAHYSTAQRVQKTSYIYARAHMYTMTEAGPWEWGSSYRGVKWEIHLRVCACCCVCCCVAACRSVLHCVGCVVKRNEWIAKAGENVF